MISARLLSLILPLVSLPAMAADGGGGTVFFGFIVIVIGGGIYLAPTIIASRKGHPNTTSIAIINITLGWSLIGWIIALVWAVKESEAPYVATFDSSQQPLIPKPNVWAEPVAPTHKACPYCAEDVLVAAIKCKHCGSDLAVAV